MEQTPGVLNFYIATRRRFPSDLISWWALRVHLGEGDGVVLDEARKGLRRALSEGDAKMVRRVSGCVPTFMVTILARQTRNFRDLKTS